MFKCVILLAVLGSSTSYHNHGGYFQPHPTYPSYRPSQWNHPGHSGHSSSWHYQSGNPDGFGWFNPSGGQTGNTGQWPQPIPSLNSHYPGPTGFNTQDDDSDHESDTDSDSEESDQDGNVSSGTDDQMKNQFTFNQSSGIDIRYGNKPNGSEKIGQGGNIPHQAADFVMKPFHFTNKESTVNRQNDTLEPESIGQSDTTGHIPVTNPRPFQLNEHDDTLMNRGGINISNIKKPTEGTKNQTSNPFLKPVTNQTSETDQTLNQAYITGPDNTLYDLRANQTVTNDTNLSQNDTLKPNAPVTVNATDRPFRPSTPAPAPSIGSIPVPVLGQFLAPSLQWNVGIYTKMETPYSQICGGTLVKTDAVLTAAHCFWGDDAALRPALFAAAAGKLQRTWGASGDTFAQYSNIRVIHIPPRFQGAKTSFQDDLAIARLYTPFEYGPGVKPACVDFDRAVERTQLQGNNKGTIVGWGLTEPNGPPSERLNFLQLPYLEIEQCIQRVPVTFLKYITSDKICAGDFRTGLAACKGDSGGGLVYTTNNIPYLRGIVSTAPRDANQCNAFTPATFTYITAHMTFLTDYIPTITEECRAMYEPENKTVETGSSTLNGGNSNVTESGELKANVTVENRGNLNVVGESGQLQNVKMQIDQGKSNGVPALLPMTITTGQGVYNNCQCVCN